MKEAAAPFSSSAGVFDWIARFITADQGQVIRSLTLDRFEMLTSLAGNPERCAPVIHIAGSKGKGSVTGMITGMLEAWGLRAARYTSPHVSAYQERITLGNRFFDEAVYIAAGETLRGVVESLALPGNPARAYYEEEPPNFFELMTLYFFLVTRLARCDVMVVETGIGGRLDSTNVVDPLVSVITEIEAEHTEVLGTTLAAIAGEKAGIIKKGRPLILMEQEDEALEVFRKAAAEKDSPLIYFPENAEIRDLNVHREGTSFTLSVRNGNLFPAPLELSLGIPGEVQAKNAGLAALAVRSAFPGIGEEAVVRGLKTFSLPARFERIQDDPVLIIDGAHTPVSTRYCTRTFTSLYGRGGILIFGCAARKDARSMAQTLAPEFSRILITTPGGVKMSNPEQVYETFREILAGQSPAGRPAELLLISDTGEAIAKALQLGRETGLPALGIGSFYLAAEIRNAVKK
ncbi:MAG: tetrahydrofolate synthase [Spirochaetaceae bacterium]|jgi:dihydrofolate synthase/folylpolyglutamate synthase|nr:tetrahydrofolate synthase [Spirochaetaceae bacterium]